MTLAATTRSQTRRARSAGKPRVMSRVDVLQLLRFLSYVGFFVVLCIR